MTNRQLQDEPFSVIILAGGFGRRLGRDKATCMAAGRPLLHWTALAAAGVTDDILVVRRPDQQFLTAMGAPWRELTDLRAERGPMAGLEAALHEIEHDLAVLVACDMPLLRRATLRAVAAGANGVEIAMPQIGGFAQPLLAAYRRGIEPVVRGLLDRNEGRLRALLPLVPHRLLDESALRSSDASLESFVNVNRTEDLERVIRILRARQPGNEHHHETAPPAEEHPLWPCTDES